MVKPEQARLAKGNAPVGAILGKRATADFRKKKISGPEVGKLGK